MNQAMLTTTDADLRTKHNQGQDHDNDHQDHDHPLAWVDRDVAARWRIVWRGFIVVRLFDIRKDTRFVLQDR